MDLNVKHFDLSVMDLMTRLAVPGLGLRLEFNQTDLSFDYSCFDVDLEMDSTKPLPETAFSSVSLGHNRQLTAHRVIHI